MNIQLQVILKKALRAAMPAILAVLPLCACSAVPGQSVGPIVIDASQPLASPAPTLYEPHSAASPSGNVIGLNSRYLTMDGKPWLPVMGEFHFSRYPAAQWEEEILKMKAAGVNIIATYVIWIHHEEVQGQFNWKEQRDLRAFADLCARHGMYLVVRVGPWAHGEVRNGGFPDWVLEKSQTRRNDPAYLDFVRIWYGQIGQQLTGKFWKDGGPVIGVQLENEYARKGPGAGEEHILELKKLALAAGLDAPLFFVTAWDNAVVPAGAVLPVHGGYSDAPWDTSRAKWPPAEVYAFRLTNRVAANLPPTVDVKTADSVPYLTAELGGGTEDTYHRRPVLSADDVAALAPVMLGSGVNLFGSYMFQGGENPDGVNTTLQESQATKYPNDVPVKSYDFQAPIGEYGEERASLRKMKVFNYFLNDFGEQLAPMAVHAPAAQPANAADLSVTRATIRSNGDAGYLFLNNHVRGAVSPARPATQFEIHLPAGTLAVPQHPVEIPADAYFIWPFNLRVHGVTIRYSTAQLFTRTVNAGTETLYFEAIPGIPVEYAIDAAGIKIEQAAGATVSKDNATIYVRGGRAGADRAIEIATTHGGRLRIVTLSREQAEDAWKASIGGEDRLLITAQDFFSNPAATPARIWLRQRGDSKFAFTVMPPLRTAPKASLPLHATGEAYTAQAAEQTWKLQVKMVHPAGIAPPVKLGPLRKETQTGVAEAPEESAFEQAAKWQLDIPAGGTAGLGDLFLKVSYTGDIARLNSKSHLLDDNFYNGQPWLVGLRRYLDLSHANQLELEILPLRKDAPIYLEDTGLLNFPASGQLDVVKSITLVPEYQMTIDTQ